MVHAPKIVEQGGRQTRHTFAGCINERFGPLTWCNMFGKLASLRKTSNIHDYMEHFLVHVTCRRAIDEQQQVNIYTVVQLEQLKTWPAKNGRGAPGPREQGDPKHELMGVHQLPSSMPTNPQPQSILHTCYTNNSSIINTLLPATLPYPLSPWLRRRWRSAAIWGYASTMMSP